MNYRIVFILIVQALLCSHVLHAQAHTSDEYDEEGRKIEELKLYINSHVADTAGATANANLRKEANLRLQYSIDSLKAEVKKIDKATVKKTVKTLNDSLSSIAAQIATLKRAMATRDSAYQQLNANATHVTNGQMNDINRRIEESSNKSAGIEAAYNTAKESFKTDSLNKINTDSLLQNSKSLQKAILDMHNSFAGIVIKDTDANVNSINTIVTEQATFDALGIDTKGLASTSDYRQYCNFITTADSAVNVAYNETVISELILQAEQLWQAAHLTQRQQQIVSREKSLLAGYCKATHECFEMITKDANIAGIVNSVALADITSLLMRADITRYPFLTAELQRLQANFATKGGFNDSKITDCKN